MSRHTTFRIKAPFTDSQIESLNRYQDNAPFHPFTCVNGHVLEATRAGLRCPVNHNHSQNWAWGFMADSVWLDDQLTV